MGPQRGVLVFGSHLGSFDALRVFAQLREDVKIRVVIDLEQNPAISAILNALNPTLAASIINARQDGTTTALAIKEALDERALVTLLVDRARPGNQVVDVDFLGARALAHRTVDAGGSTEGASRAVFRAIPRRQPLRSAFRAVCRSTDHAAGQPRNRCRQVVATFRRPAGTPCAQRALQLVQLL